MVIIDVGQVDDERGLHALLKAELGFPAFYGMNWDAEVIVPTTRHPG
ncbi:barstar family protein [Streptomyces sp. NPDC006475]